MSIYCTVFRCESLRNGTDLSYNDQQTAAKAASLTTKVLSEYPQIQLTTSEFIVGKLLGGWSVRQGESASRGPDEIILFGKYTVLPGRRADLNLVLLDGLALIDKEEMGTRSILLIESENDGNVSYVMERFADQAAVEAHGKGSGAAKVMSLFQELVTNREGGFCTEIV